MIRLSTCSGRPGPCPACPPFICLEQAFPCLRLTTPSLLSIVGARKMVDWTSPTVITGEADVFGKLIFSLFGLYVWEIFQTSDFDWSIITGKRKFVWPLVIIFFLCRYCLLFALIGLIISLSVTTQIDCIALYTFDSVTGNLAILTASTSLMIRTIALWERQIRIVIPLCVLCLAHWVILCRGMFIVHAVYSPETKSCIVTFTDHVFLNVGFFATMGFDFIILCFTVTALWKQRTHSDLWRLLFQDGLMYFCLTFFCNAVPAILNVINLNPLMNVIATIPAATVSTIASCRLVMRLQEFNQSKADVYVHSSQVLTNNNGTRGGPIRLAKRQTMSPAPQVMVTTDRIVVENYTPTSIGSAKTARKMMMDLEAMKEYSDTEYDRESYVAGS